MNNSIKEVNGMWLVTIVQDDVHVSAVYESLADAQNGVYVLSHKYFNRLP